MVQKVVFLDVDGVIFARNSIMSLELVQKVCKLADKVICISDLRKRMSEKDLKQYFEDIDITIHGSIPNRGHGKREVEIRQWIKENGIPINYVILDDTDYYMGSTLASQWVKVTTALGMTSANYCEAEEKLNGEANYIPRH